jgi:hypothetical protein
MVAMKNSQFTMSLYITHVYIDMFLAWCREKVATWRGKRENSAWIASKYAGYAVFFEKSGDISGLVAKWGYAARPLNAHVGT